MLYDENDINRLKSVQSDIHIINSDEPRTIPQRDGTEIKIQTHDSFISIMGDESHGKDYQSQIVSRGQNNEILMRSDDYHVFKYNQKESALNIIRTKIEQHSHIKKICQLPTPYSSVEVLAKKQICDGDTIVNPRYQERLDKHKEFIRKQINNCLD